MCMVDILMMIFNMLESALKCVDPFPQYDHILVLAMCNRKHFLDCTFETSAYKAIIFLRFHEILESKVQLPDIQLYTMDKLFLTLIYALL